MSRTTTPLPVQEAAPGRTACRHLGLDNDPLSHRDAPATEHRCYLWMQRDRIDLAHQRVFCLSETSARCPWLAVSTPLAPHTSWRRVTGWFEEALAELDGIRTGRVYNILRTVVALTVELIAALVRLARPALQRVTGKLRSMDIGWVLRQTGAPAEPMAAPALAADEEQIAASGHPAPAHALPPEDGAIAAPRRAPRIDGTSDFASLFEDGIAAARAGDRRAARAMLKEATRINPQSKEAWLWRAAVASRSRERQRCLEEMRKLDPESGRVVALLDEYDIPAPRPTGRRQPTTPAGPLAMPPTLGASAWECADCLRLNAATASTCPQCRRPSPTLEQQLIAKGEYLLLDGLAAFRRGDEEAAHRCFAVAAEAEPDNELAWYWRAKTADSTAEVVSCLEWIVGHHPENERARLDLAWARARLEREIEPASTVAGDASTELPSPSRLDWLRPALFDLAGLTAFLLGLFWLSFEIVRSSALPGIDALAHSGILPKITPPTWTVTLDPTFLPNTNVGALVPTLLGILAVRVAWALVEHRTRQQAEILALAATSMIGVFLMVRNGMGIVLGLALTVAILASGLLAREHVSTQEG